MRGWSCEAIIRVDLASPPEVWERFLDALVAYWSESVPDQLSDPEWRAIHQDRMRRRLETHPTWLWIYEQDGRTLALANFFVISGRAQIAEFYVLPSLRRHGLGRFLIEQMRLVLGGEGVRRIAINVPHSAVDRIDFWRACGFRDLAVELETSTRPSDAG